MRFLVHPPPSSSGLPDFTDAYLSGMDGRIFPSRIEMEGPVLICRRPSSESAKLNLPWPVPGIGRPVLTTTSLRERDDPYLLPVELARGKLSEVRESWASWEQSGMAIPDAFRKLQREAFQFFAKAGVAAGDLDSACQLAASAIERACAASALLIDAYTVQRLTSIRRSTHHAPGLVGSVLDSTVLTPSGQEIFHHAFNTASIPIHWKDIEPVEGTYHWDAVDQLVEFCSAHRTILRGGPLIDLSPGGLHEWLTPWKNDFLNLPIFICDYIETTISRYQGLIRLWEVAAYGNTGGALGLGEDHCLALVARTLEAAKRTDSDAQFFIRVDCPWGEYQRDGRHRLSPFQFVDALVRSNLGLAGVTLEINSGYGSKACYARDMLSISKLIDMWSQLQLQIHVNIACPSSATPDPLADPRYPVQDGVWRDRWSEETQADWLEHLVPLLLAKSSVNGVFLSQFGDGVPHRFPHAGLVTADGKLKKMFEPLRHQLHHELS
ncbi:endo-1,4-beta-xylanase [Planctomicrobium sp. SH661]|uniref:endo-1,4-beta-xylanase n=1 Tax=Planctomicrobium sp. SH661 TaxID=3448124 RepID=UPI003F5B4F49